MLSKEWHEQAVRLKKEGKSNYQIARDIWGIASKESTLRYFFNLYQKENGVIEINEPSPINQAKVLYWDMEVAPFLSFHWDKWKVNIPNSNHLTEKFMISHAWAWGDGDIEAVCITSDEVKKQDDERILYKAWHLLDEADIVVAHNGKGFDIPMVNGFFLRHGFPPPSPFKVVDTYRIAKKHFKLTSNSLAYLAEMLGVPLKLDSGGMDTFSKAYHGDQEALDHMVEYNKGDIVTLREVYYKLRAWGNDGVNMGVYSTHSAVCSACGSDNISVIDDAFQYTAVSKFQVVMCGHCNAKSRFRKSTPIDVDVTRIT